MGSPVPVATSNQQEALRPMSFVSSYDKQGDMLVNAVSVTRFLAELAPAMVQRGGDPGLSEDGGFGLSLILEALNNTIQAALELVDSSAHSTSAGV